MLGANDAVLGVLPKDSPVATDISGQAPAPQSAPPPAPVQHRKKEAGASSDAPPAAPAETPSPDSAVLGVQPETPPEPLKLPRGAFIGLRKSGGMNFSTREVVVYPDGRVAYDARGVPQKEYTRLRRVMNDGQIISLRKLLDQTNFWKAESTGKQNPDAFAYEIAAHLNLRSHEIEVHDGSVPENLKPLLERLVKLLPA